jgi:hypothetical protein
MPNGLAPWPYNFEPVPPNTQQTNFQTLHASIGSSGQTFTGTATTAAYVSIPRSRTFYVMAANIQGGTAAAGSGAITAQLIRYNSVTAADVALTAAYDLTTAIAAAGTNVNVPITATDSNAVCVPGDTLRWAVVAAGTITTQPKVAASVEASVML